MYGQHKLEYNISDVDVFSKTTNRIVNIIFLNEKESILYITTISFQFDQSHMKRQG